MAQGNRADGTSTAGVFDAYYCRMGRRTRFRIRGSPFWAITGVLAAMVSVMMTCPSIVSSEWESTGQRDIVPPATTGAQPTLSVGVDDASGAPLSGVSVQGEIITPSGHFVNVLNGVSNAGQVVFSNLTLLEAIESSWISALGPAASATSHPDLVLFETYVQGSDPYFQQQSVALSPEQMMSDFATGASIQVLTSFSASAKPIFDQTSAAPQSDSAQAAGLHTASTLPSPQPCDLDVSVCWQAVGNGNTTPDTWIPVVWGTASDNIWTDLSFAIEFSDSMEFNLGVGYGTGASFSSPGFEEGATLYSTSASGEADATVNPNNGTAYIAIYGQALGQLFQEYQCESINGKSGLCNGFLAENNYQYDAGIMPVISDGEIENERATGTPPYTSSLSDGYSLESLVSTTGDGNQQVYKEQFSSNSVINTFFSGQSDFQFGLDVAAIISAFFPEALPGVLAISLNAGISDSDYSYSTAWADFDGPNGQGLAAYVWVGETEYVSGSFSGYLPLMGLTLEGSPGIPTDLSAPSVTSDSVTLDWTNPAESVSDNTLYWGTSCSSLSSSTEVTERTSYVVGPLSASTSYCFAVSASNGNAQSGHSATIKATTSASSGGGGGCVAYGTPVLTPSGYVPVEDLRPGNLVEEYNLTSRSLVSGTFVSANTTRVTEAIDLNNGLLYLTPTDQPVYIENATFVGWLHDPQNLSIADSIFDPVTQSWIHVNSVRLIEDNTEVYDVQVTGQRNFVASGVLLLDKVA